MDWMPIVGTPRRRDKLDTAPRQAIGRRIRFRESPEATHWRRHAPN